jgi:hypothetical protein
MIDMHCTTNLDGYENTSWPMQACGVPNIGDWVKSIDGRKTLTVVAVTHCWDGRRQLPYVQIELHRK